MAKNAAVHKPLESTSTREPVPLIWQTVCCTSIFLTNSAG